MKFVEDEVAIGAVGKSVVGVESIVMSGEGGNAESYAIDGSGRGVGRVRRKREEWHDGAKGVGKCCKERVG